MGRLQEDHYRRVENSAKSKTACTSTGENWFHFGIDAGGLETVGTGKPFGTSTMMKSIVACFVTIPLKKCSLSVACCITEKETKTIRKNLDYNCN